MLKTTGLALAGSVLASGTAAAHGDGGGNEGPEGDFGARAYTERAHGRLSAVGVEFPASVLSGLPTDSVASHLELPRGDAGRFEWVGMDWNPAGHEPPFLYGHPHFDFHFYILDEESVESIPPIFPPDTVPYDIPDALMPAGTSTVAPRAVVPEMGEHLNSVPASVPGSPGNDGWSVYIWGAYDPDGDGTGQMIFMEPMITVEYFENLRGDGNSDAEEGSSIPMPERFVKAGWYPTEYVTRYHSHGDTFTVSLESFEQFRGYGRR